MAMLRLWRRVGHDDRVGQRVQLQRVVVLPVDGLQHQRQRAEVRLLKKRQREMAPHCLGVGLRPAASAPWGGTGGRRRLGPEGGARRQPVPGVLGGDQATPPHALEDVVTEEDNLLREVTHAAGVARKHRRRQDAAELAGEVSRDRRLGQRGPWAGVARPGYEHKPKVRIGE